jgi:uncharacterized protein
MSKNNKSEIKHQTFALEIKAIADDGTFTGYGSVFGNVDSYGDIIQPGAFKNTLINGGKKVKLLWQHLSDQPIGVYTNIQEDSYGLLVTGQINLDVQQGAEAYALLKQGALDGLSIGFQTVRSDIDETSGIRTLTEIKLWEISLVTFPANELATVTTVKSALELSRVLAALNEKQLSEVRDLINTFNTSPQDVSAPPVVIDEHPEKPDADKLTDAPHDQDVMHSLEQLSAQLKQFIEHKAE